MPRSTRNHLQAVYNTGKENEKEWYQDKFQIQNLLDENEKIEKRCNELQIENTDMSKDLNHTRLLLNEARNEGLALKEKDESRTLWYSSLEETNKELRFKIKMRDEKIEKLNELKAESEEKHASELESMVAAKDSHYQIKEELNLSLKAKSEEVEKLKATQTKSDLVIKGLKYKFNEMKNKSKSANEYNEDLKTQLHKAKTKMDTIIAELKDTKSTEEFLKKVNEKLNNHVEVLLKDAKKVKDETSKTLQEQKCLLESKTKELRVKTSKLESVVREFKMKEQVISGLEMECIKTKNSEELYIQQNKNLEDSIEELKQESKAKDENLQKVLIEKETNNDQVKIFNGLLKSKTDEIKTMKAVQDETNLSLKSLDNKYVEMKKTLGTTKKLNKELQDQVEVLKRAHAQNEEDQEAKLQELRTENKDKVKTLTDVIDSKSEEVKALRFNNNFLKISAKKANIQCEEIMSKADSEKKLNNELVDQVKLLTKDLAITQENHQKLKKEFSQSEQEIKDQLNVKTEELKLAKMQIENLEKSFEEKEQLDLVKYNQAITELKSQQNEVQQKLAVTEEQNKQLIAEIEKQKLETKKIETESFATTETLHSLVESKSEELRRLKIQLEDKEEAYTKDTSQVINELKKKNTENEWKVDSLSKLNENLKGQNEVLNEELKIKNEKPKEIAFLKSQVKEIRKSLSIEKTQCVNLMQLKEDDEQQISELKKDLSEAEKNIERLERKVVSLQNISQLEASNLVAEKNDDTAQSVHNKNTNKEVEDLEKKLKEAEGTIIDLKVKLALKDKKIQEKDEDFAERLEYQEYQNNIINIKTENNLDEVDPMTMKSAKDPATQNDNFELREKIKEFNDLNKSLQAIIREKEDRICRLGKENDELRFSVNEKKSTIKTRSSTKDSILQDVSKESTTINGKSAEKRASGDTKNQAKDDEKKKRKLD